MLLTEVLSCLASEVVLERITHAQYQRSVQRFDEYLEKQADTSDLTVANVNGYLSWLQTGHYQLAPISVCNHRAGILRVWNYAVYPLEIAPQYIARRIRLPNVPPKPVVAWQVEDVGKLISAARSMRGKLNNGIPASEFLVAWIWLGLETGLRPSDLRLLRWENIDFARNSLSICQHKTRQIHTCLFGPESRVALEVLQPYGFDQVFPLGKSGVTRWEQVLYKIASRNGFQRKRLQGLGTLRKTHASEIYTADGLAASAESLGHRSGTKIARDHYVDSRLNSGRRPTVAAQMLADFLRNPPAKDQRKQA